MKQMIDVPFMDDVSKEKYELSQYFMRSYFAARAGLKKLGVIRTDSNLRGDYAEWIVANVLNVELCESTITKGYDAESKNKKVKYQIKSRGYNTNTAFPFKSLEKTFDVFVGVFFTKTNDVKGIITAPYEVVVEYAQKTKNDFRWNKKTENDPRIQKIFWS